MRGRARVLLLALTVFAQASVGASTAAFAADRPSHQPAGQPADAASGTRPDQAPADRRAQEAVLEDVVRAAARPESEPLERLLAAGAPADGRTRRRQTPLQVAAEHGRLANVRLLLPRQDDLDRVAARGLTALGWAVRGGHMDVARSLLEAGADPDEGSNPLRAPVVVAVESGNEAMVALLIERGSRVFDDAELAGAVLLALGRSDDAGIAARLVPRLAERVATSADARDAAALAILSSTPPVADAIQRQLGAAASSRELQTTLLMMAARRRRADVAASAVARGADVNARHPRFGSPLAAAVAAGDAETVAVLIGAGADWKTAGVDREKLDRLAGRRLEDLRAAELVAAIGSSDVRDAAGEPPLFRAAREGNVGSVAMLLGRGMNPSATAERWPGDEGWTPLLIAAANGHAAVVQQLLDAGAPVDHRNAAGRTALGFAAFYGHSAVVAALLAAGADPDAADRRGMTPRRLAKLGGEPKTLGLLSDLPPGGSSSR